jgi:hypothetical protein
MAFFAALGGLLFGDMGGHQSKQSISASTKVVGSVVQTVSQDCITYVNSANEIVIRGNGNVIGTVDQSVSIKVSTTCGVFNDQDSTFTSKLNDSMTQVLSDQQIALTQWLDNSKDDTENSISQTIKTNVKQATVQTCLNNVNGHNVFAISGDDNVVGKATQASALDVISSCMLNQGQQSSTVNDISNTINQHSTYTSQNPLAFLTDALEAIMKSAMTLLAVVFIVIVCFIVIYMSLRRGKKPPPPTIYQAGPSF